MRHRDRELSNAPLVIAFLVSAWSLAIAANPALVITSPTSARIHSTTAGGLTVAGLVVSSAEVTHIKWNCETCFPASGLATTSGQVQKIWSFQIDRLRPGPNTITVTAENADGRTAANELVVNFAPSDRSTPVVTIVANTARDNRVTSGVTQLSGICTDNVGCASIAWANAAGGGGTCDGGANWTCNEVGLRPGTNTLMVTGFDAAGNAGSHMMSVVYDEPLTITTLAMAPAGINRQYRPRRLSATGGTRAGYRWDTSTASRPSSACAGLSISADGIVRGLPTAAGACVFTVRVTDNNGQTATRRLTIPVSEDDPEGPHDYFGNLKTLPEVFPIADCRASVPADNGACSLRNQDQLDRLSNAPGPNLNPNGFIYRPESDVYGDRQDAGKLEITPCPNGCSADSGSIPNNQVINMPLDFLNTGNVLITFDVWLGPEWRSSSCGGHIGSQSNMKSFQIRGGAVERGQAYFGTRHRFGQAVACDDVGAHDNHVFPVDSLQNMPEGITDDAPYSPTGKNALPAGKYQVKHSTWTRYLMLVELTRSGSDETFADWRNTYLGAAPTVGARSRIPLTSEVPHPDTWHAFTIWMCDEGRDCTRVLWRAPWKLQNENGVRRNLSEFDFQFNTSTRANARTGNLMAYVRNWVALRNYPIDLSGNDSLADVENNPAILKRPVR